MKFYDELKAEMETIQQQMAEVKKSQRTGALKKVKELCKEFSFSTGMLRVDYLKGVNQNKISRSYTSIEFLI